jgi:hypothetical protein
MNKWQRWLALSGEERAAFHAALVLLPLAALGLRFLGFQRVVRLALGDRRHDGLSGGEGGLQAPREQGAGSSCGIARAESLARMVEAAGRYGLSPPSCLHRSLVLCFLLRRAGIRADLRIGTRRLDGGFEAHAWVELGGRVLNDEPDVRQRFAPLEPANASWSSGILSATRAREEAP